VQLGLETLSEAGPAESERFLGLSILSWMVCCYLALFFLVVSLHKSPETPLGSSVMLLLTEALL